MRGTNYSQGGSKFLSPPSSNLPSLSIIKKKPFSSQRVDAEESSIMGGA